MPYKDPQKIKEYQKKYREANKEKKNEQCKDYYWQHRDEILAKNKEYQNEHRQQINEKSLEYYYANKDSIGERQREYHKVYYAENRDEILKHGKQYYKQNREQYTERCRANRHKKANWLRKIKSQLKCIICGENHPACLDFHHIDVKNGLISRMVKRVSEKRILEEIAKCEVLCANCHRKLHSEERKPKLLTGGRSQEYRHKRSEWFRELKSKLSCVCCGESDSTCLDFHHKNPKEKDKAVGNLVREPASEKRILDEIAKCEPVCSNCHRKLHYKE